MDRALSKVLIVTLAFLARQGKVLGEKQITYPEVRSDLQKYQDVSKCYPDVGEWICLFRNYYEDPDFGGNANCLSFKRFGAYQNFTTNVVFTFGEHGKANTLRMFLVATQGTLSEPNDCCEFIYDENCGSTPKYSIYEQSCDF
ncbi:hypothetical protein HPB51_006684 [Rhipicephalus microplus]|uniref:Lipocalin n=1 Tax=Rhipicephalus microplus TaxID=6941 RepID=A0A9J6E7Q7_RHIMP|nr:hypothetical protein HPB51_006684 [Rhipicephalus microplus]